MDRHQANKRIKRAATAERLVDNIKTRALSIASVLQDHQDGKADQDLVDCLYDVEVDRDSLNIHLENLWEVLSNET